MQADYPDTRLYEHVFAYEGGPVPGCYARSGRSGYTSSIVVSATYGTSPIDAWIFSAPPARRSRIATTPTIWCPASRTRSIALIVDPPVVTTSSTIRQR